MINSMLLTSVKIYTPNIFVVLTTELLNCIVIFSIIILFLTKKNKTWITMLQLGVSAVLISFFSACVESLNSGGDYYSYAFLLALIIPVFFSFSDDTSKKVFVFVSACMFNVIFLGLAETFAATIYEASDMAAADGIFIILRIVFSIISVTVAYYAIKSLKECAISNIKEDTWYLMSIYPLAVSMAIVLLFVKSTTVAPEFDKRLSLLFWSLCTMLGFYFIEKYIIIAIERFQTKQELEFKDNLLVMERSYYKMLNENLNQLRIMKHDFRHHVNTLYALNSNGNSEEIEKYLNSMLNGMESTDIQRLCVNDTLNVILSHYIHRAESFGIKIDTKMQIPSEFSIDATELTIILGNAIENAFYAINDDKNPLQTKVIKIALRYIDCKLIIMVSNTFYGNVKMTANGDVLSTKKNGGLGLKSIKTIAEKYNGDTVISFVDNVFSVYVTLNALSMETNNI